MKKFISILLAAMLILGMLPATALNVFAAGGTFTRVTSVEEITAGGKFIITYGTKAMPKTLSSGKFSPSTVTVSNNTITVDNDDLVWTIAATGNGISLNNGSSYLAYNSSTNFKLQSASYDWTVEEYETSDTFAITSTASTSRGVFYRAGTQNKFGAYSNTNLGGTEYFCVELYKLQEGGTTEPDCTHPNKYEKDDGYAAQCGVPGMTNSVYCPDCEETVTPQEEIPALTHNYVGGKCEHCGEAEPVAPVFPEIPESGNYQLITNLNDVLTGGQYVFVVEYEGNYYALGNEIDDKIAPVETVVSGEYVYGSAPSWKVGSYDGGLILFNGTKYLGHSSGANFTSAADPFKWTVQDNEDGTFLLISSADAERAVAYNYNSGNHRFGPYDISNLDKAGYSLRLRVYKLTEGGEVEFNGELNFVENGKVTTVTPAYGSSYTLPDATVTAPTGYAFEGWVEAALSETTAAPETIHEVGATITVPASKTYYALYTKSEITQGGGTVEAFQKITSVPASWGGTYLIVCEDSNVAFNGALTTLDAANNNVAVTINDGSITENVESLKNATFTIDADGHIKSASGYYIGHTADANKLSSSKTTQYGNTITFTTGGDVHIVASGKPVLRYNAASGQYRFRYFKSSTYSGQKAIQLYVLTEVAGGGSTTTTYYTTVVEDSCAHGKYESKNATTVACQYCGATKDAPVNVGGVAYESIQAAAEAGTVTLNQNIADVAITGELKLDLNGKTATNVTATKIYAYDSTATTTSEEFATLSTTSEVVIDNTVKVGEKDVRYIALKGENNTYTFHVLELKLTAVTLRTTQAGIYYKAEIVCDDTLRAATAQYGVVLSIDNMPGTDFAAETGDVNAWTVKDGAPEKNKVFTSGSVFNILKGENVETDKARGEKAIYANAYLKLKDEYGGIVVMSDQNYGAKEGDEGFNGISFSLKGVMEKLDNEVFSGLSDAQKTRVAQFYKDWESAMSTWNLPAISAAADNLPAAE